MSGPENLDFFTDQSLVDDPYDYYDAIRRRPVWRESAHGVVMVSGYDEAVAVQRDAEQTLSVLQYSQRSMVGDSDRNRQQRHLGSDRAAPPAGYVRPILSYRLILRSTPRTARR